MAYAVYASQRGHTPLASVVVLLGLLVSGSAYAQNLIEETLIIGQDDYLSLLPTGKTSSAFGLDKNLSETPRSVTEVSQDLIQKFALRSVDDLVRLTPGAFTSSFFGIKGAMDIRGEPADNYYRGFRRIANPGAFNTNVRGAEKLEILRGPVSPLYGNGSVGGQMNYIPKTAKSSNTKTDGIWFGDIDVTLGSYKQRIVSSNLSVPIAGEANDGGMHVFAEVEDSESYYHLYEPSSELLQIAFDFDLSSNTTLQFGGQYQSSDSIQVPGWNRVTQNLIDHGIYITGNAQNRNTGADPFQLQPQESGVITSRAPISINNAFSLMGRFCQPVADPATPTIVAPFNAAAKYNGMNLECLGGFPDYPLENVGTARLDHKTTFIDENDFADSQAITAYIDVSHTFYNDNVWASELFYDHLDHKKYQSWGFTANYPNARAIELRTRYTFELDSKKAIIKNIVGGNYRRENLELKHAYFDETFDFRDLTVGATPNDRIAPAVDAPLANVTFTTDANGINTGIANGTVYRNYNLHEISTNNNIGIFLLSDIAISHLNILLGGRYDYFDVESEDTAKTLLGNRFDSITDHAGKQHKTKTATSFNASLSYRFEYGVIPYITYANSNALSANQLGGLIPSTIQNGAFLQDSQLIEAGAKFEGFDGRLYTALTYYEQEKSQQSGQTQALASVFGKGYELEMRAVINNALSIVATATHSKTTEIGDNILTVINGADFSSQNNLLPQSTYGGRVAGVRATFVGKGTELDRGGLPNNIVSLFGTYLVPFGKNNLTSSLGFTWVDETATDVFESVILPGYLVLTGSLRYQTRKVTALVQLNNLTDAKYYTSADLFDSVVVKPSEARTASLTLTYAFGH